MNARSEALPGLVYGMPIEAYHALPSLSCSGMHDLARSPAHYFGLHIDPDRPPRAEKPGQLEGNLAHCAVLEPDAYSDRYTIGPEERRNSKAWGAFAENETRTIIKRAQHDAAMAQAKSIRALPDVAQLLSAGHPEVSAFWIDEQTGVPCRCRPDWVHPTAAGVILVDVKTYGDASPREFSRQIARKGYHRQSAFYSDGYAAASGLDVLGFVFVAVECAYPFAACAVMLDGESLERGRAECRVLIDCYAECLRTGQWPGYSDRIEQVSLPAWALSPHNTESIL